jgi:hypothetical protein
MLKSSSLCLYISNLGTFWLKIEQPPTKMATTAELDLTWDPMGNSHKNLLV